MNTHALRFQRFLIPLVVGVVLATPACKQDGKNSETSHVPARTGTSPARATTSAPAPATTLASTFEGRLEFRTAQLRNAIASVDKLRTAHAPRPLYRRLKPTTELTPDMTAGLLPVYYVALRALSPSEITSQAALQIIGLLEPPGADYNNGYEDVPGPYPEELALLEATYHWRAAAGQYVPPEEALLIGVAAQMAKKHAVLPVVRKSIANILPDVKLASRAALATGSMNQHLALFAFDGDEEGHEGHENNEHENDEHDPASHDEDNGRDTESGNGNSVNADSNGASAHLRPADHTPLPESHPDGSIFGQPDATANGQNVHGPSAHDGQGAVSNPTGNAGSGNGASHPNAMPINEFVAKLLLQPGQVPIPPETTLESAFVKVKAAADKVAQEELSGVPRPELKVLHKEEHESDLSKAGDDIRDMIVDIGKDLLAGKETGEAIASGVTGLIPGILIFTPSETGTGDQFDFIQGPRAEEVELYKAINIYEQLYTREHRDDRYRQLYQDYLAYKNGAAVREIR
jgi:hypothetical protein